ncbi:MAG: Rne/Rng family ribonuclease [Myxococcales bacterium]|nr:Rne/Rng family ribonuclease [Myxococcales bacterium]
MPSKMLINVEADETRVAIVDGGRLVNLQVENALREQRRGNIYKARVQKIEASFQAAFVDYGAAKHGFLPVSDIHPRYSGGSSSKEIRELLKGGQELIVQVTRDEVGHKGATVTTYVSLPGRYLVLIPESDKTGVSRRLDETERTRLREIAKKADLPPGYGLIVRTAGQEVTRTELNRDLQTLLRLWTSIQQRATERKRPGLLHRDQSLALRFVRDYLTSDVKQILIDDDEAFAEVDAFIASVMPRKRKLIKRYDGSVPLFAAHQLEGQIETAFSREVRLACGGSLVIDHTEALVAIDVNSGRAKERDAAQTILTANLEAAREAARQVMLRDLGGLIVIDFIDMAEKEHVRQVEAALKESFGPDKARTRFSKISDFGLLEISRQRVGTTLERARFQACPHCGGAGRVQAPAAASLRALRQLRELATRQGAAEIRVTLPVDVANYLNNRYRGPLVLLEEEHGCRVEVVATTGAVSKEEEIVVTQRREAERTKSSGAPAGASVPHTSTSASSLAAAAAVSAASAAAPAGPSAVSAASAAAPTSAEPATAHSTAVEPAELVDSSPSDRSVEYDDEDVELESEADASRPAPGGAAEQAKRGRRRRGRRGGARNKSDAAAPSAAADVAPAREASEPSAADPQGASVSAAKPNGRRRRGRSRKRKSERPSS